MNISHDATSNCRLIEPSCLGLDSNISNSAMTLLEILALRCTQREFSPEPMPLYRLSRLLWAAFGFNRPELGLRTAPSACNSQEIDIYVSTLEGLYLYDAQESSLVCIARGDIRALTGSQDFVATAPVNLIYVADYKRMHQVATEQQELMAAISAGCISQNVSLMCAAEGLATVVRALINRNQLAEVMGLRESQRILLAQTVGTPADWTGNLALPWSERA